MKDWSEGLVEAKVALVRAEHALALGRWEEGFRELTKALEGLQLAKDDVACRLQTAVRIGAADGQGAAASASERGLK